MAPRRRYTAKDKAEAVGIALVKGTEGASEDTGIPRTTIAYWMDQPAFVELRHKTREDVGDALWVAMQTGIARVVELIPKTEDVQKVAVALGVLYDKRALMMGQATSRSESRSLTEDLDDDDRHKLRLLIDEVLATPEADPTGTEG